MFVIFHHVFFLIFLGYTNQWDIPSACFMLDVCWYCPDHHGMNYSSLSPPWSWADGLWMVNWWLWMMVMDDKRWSTTLPSCGWAPVIQPHGYGWNPKNIYDSTGTNNNGINMWSTIAIRGYIHQFLRIFRCVPCKTSEISSLDLSGPFKSQVLGVTIGPYPQDLDPC